MRMLVACEVSGVVRRAFASLGWDAWSCDILPSEDDSPNHITGDAREVVLSSRWDLLIAHPPCTYLAVSGMHWTVRGYRSPKLTEDALEFARFFMEADVPMTAIENPVSVISTKVRKPDQIIHPWQFGHPESKKTCLWLRNLPPLIPTDILPLPASGRWSNQTPSGNNRYGPSPDRARKRSRTYSGIASAMAEQWSAAAGFTVR